MKTILESDEDIRRAQAALRKAATKSTRQEKTYRPTARPPVAFLTICDDGQSTGEVLRIRDEQFVVGRDEGDLRLPFDHLLSSRHFAVTRQIVKDKWRWVITDLQSKNGVFFRVSRAPLNDGAEFIVGGGCYKLELLRNAGPETAEWVGGVDKAPATKAMQSGQPAGSAVLSEVVRGGVGERVSLTKDEYTIGFDSTCDLVRENDDFIGSVHAKLSRSERGTWVISSNHAKNGVWVRLPQIGIGAGDKCDFQAGEQRLRLNFGEGP